MKKRFFVFFLIILCLSICSCGSQTGSVTLVIDDDVIVSNILIMKSSGGKLTQYSEKEIDLVQGEEYTRTLAKGSYYYFIEAEGGPTYTKDKNRMFKISYQYNMLSFDIIPGENIILNFSEAKPNVFLFEL